MTKLRKYKWLCIVLFFAFLVSMLFAPYIEDLLHLNPNIEGIDKDALEVHFVDVGQGDSILIRFPNEDTMIIDSGITDYRDKLLNYIDNVFLKNGEKGFDYGVLTHSDSDHSSNMAIILDNYTFGTFYRPKKYSKNVEKVSDGVDTKTYDDFVKSLYASDTENIKYNETGESLKISEDCRVDWYAPDLNKYEENNSYSPIMVLEYKGKRICLTGDATVENEAEAIANEIGDVDVLKLGHHGSNTSNSKEFLDETLPEHIVICVGKNSYGLPNKYVLERLQAYDQEHNKTAYANLKTTQDDGNVICFVNNDGTIGFEYIEDVDDYVFISWYWIAGGGAVIMFVFVLLPNNTKKYRARKFKNEK